MIKLKPIGVLRISNSQRSLCFFGDVIVDGWDNLNELYFGYASPSPRNAQQVAFGLNVLQRSFGRPISNHGRVFDYGDFYYDEEIGSGFVFVGERGWSLFSGVGG